jgi:putative glutamine amidotransferase
MTDDQRPLIGVPTQTLQVIDGVPEGLPRSWVMNHRYFTALALAGAAPVMVPLLEESPALRALYERLDGVFLAGGVDLDPASYGHERHTLCGSTDADRDRVELLLTRWALEEGKPVLGVCRGMQVINVARGGSLYQDCGEQFDGSIKHDYFPNAGYARDYLAHPVRVVEGTRLGRVLGAGEVPVNSMHHQGVRDLGQGLAASAYSADGLVEALEAPGDGFAVGVQWHPEMLVESDPGTRRLFDAFVAEARAFRAGAALQGAGG